MPTIYILFTIVLSAFTFGSGLARPAHGVVFIVNSDANDDDGDCNGASGDCTLREAINAANADGDADIIEFDLGGSPVIDISSGDGLLPPIIQPVTINGNTGGATRVVLNGNGVAGPGLDLLSDGISIQNLVIVNFNSSGIRMVDTGPQGNTIQGNYIGLAADGSTAAGNLEGILLNGSGNNLIGGSAPGQGNVISGNDNSGIALINAGSQQNRIKGNFVGTNASGMTAVPNGIGILFSGADVTQNTIGGTEAGSGNLVSGNDGNGIWLNAGVSQTLIQGNWIGTDVMGTSALGNSSRGLLIQGSPDNTVGGPEEAARNIISGNQGDGMELNLDSTGNIIQGNFIGVDVTGTTPMPNLGNRGIVLLAANNLIGGAQPNAGNVISGHNPGIGILITLGGDGNMIEGNFIGTDRSKTLDLGNALGIAISSGVGDPVNNTIGGLDPLAGNVLAFNASDGIAVFNGNGNGILGNSIFNNGGLGIALNPGTNNDQAAPNLTGAAIDGFLAVQGTLASIPNTEFLLEFFNNTSCDPSGFGEGEIFLGRISIVTDANGEADFEFAVNQTFQFRSANYTVEKSQGTAVIEVIRNLAKVGGNFITATATDPNHNTSEFSNCLEAVGAPASSVDFATSDGTALAGVDYVAANGALTFTGGETEGAFTVALLPDNSMTGDKIVHLSLSNPSEGGLLGDPDTALLTIVDDSGTLFLSGGGNCRLNPESRTPETARGAWYFFAVLTVLAGMKRRMGTFVSIKSIL